MSLNNILAGYIQSLHASSQTAAQAYHHFIRHTVRSHAREDIAFAIAAHSLQPQYRDDALSLLADRDAYREARRNAVSHLLERESQRKQQPLYFAAQFTD